ncbi:MAG: cell division protein ZapA [Defluviitaleaceae bacterium]|nr:cell division protein ZapA [Defluviitaleaceae bacterium]
MEKKKVNVVIGDEIITLTSDENPEYLQRLARYVDEKMREVLTKSINATLDEKIRTLVIALNIADDYIKTADAYRHLDELHTQYVLETARVKEENTTLKKETAELKVDLDLARVEIEELKKEAVEEDESADNLLTMPLTSKQRKGRSGNAQLG